VRLSAKAAKPFGKGVQPFDSSIMVLHGLDRRASAADVYR
jgi:hypothetical protein